MSDISDFQKFCESVLDMKRACLSMGVDISGLSFDSEDCIERLHAHAHMEAGVYVSPGKLDDIVKFCGLDLLIKGGASK